MLKILRKNLTVTLLALIFVLALFLRVYKLESFPVGFHIDEAILGYTGYSLIHTFKDTNGVFLPMYTEVFGDYLPTGYHILTIPTILLLGLTEFATRLPGAIIGALTIFPVFFLSYALFRNRAVSLLSALFFTISPWSLILSRGSSEAGVSVFFVLSGFALIIQSIRRESIKYLLWGGAFLISSFFFYHTPRVFVPLMLFAILIFLFPEIKKLKNRAYRKYLIIVAIVIIGIVGLLTVSFKGATARFNQISIFSFPETRLVMEEQTREDGVLQTPPVKSRAFHNKIINNTFAFVENYSEYLSINTLFVRPGLPKIFAVPNSGLIYIIFIPFFFFGIVRVLFEKDKLGKLVILWILVAPITAALTVDDVPNMRRASVLFPIIEIVSVYSLVTFLSMFKKSKKYVRLSIISILILSFSWSFIYFEHQYFVHGKLHRPWVRNNGFSNMMARVTKDYDNYDLIVTAKSQGGYPLFLFYSRYDPAKYQKEGSPKDRDFKGFGKFIFTPDACPFISSHHLIPKSGRIIFVEDGTCPESKLLQKVPFTYILREDGTKAFRVVYVKDDKIFKTQ